MESIFLVTAIVGLVDLVRAVKNQDWEKVAIVVGAGVIGALTGMFGIDGLTVPQGIQAGLAASGVYRLSKVAGSGY